MNLNDKQNRTESPDVPAEMAEVTAVDVVSPVRADAAEESVEEIGARTLSPGRLVMKRFFRSRLSMTGLIVLLVLFVFSFAGPLMKFLPLCLGEEAGGREPADRASILYRGGKPGGRRQ